MKKKYTIDDFVQFKEGDVTLYRSGGEIYTEEQAHAIIKCSNFAGEFATYTSPMFMAKVLDRISNVEKLMNAAIRAFPPKSRVRRILLKD